MVVAIAGHGLHGEESRAALGLEMQVLWRTGGLIELQLRWDAMIWGR